MFDKPMLIQIAENATKEKDFGPHHVCGLQGFGYPGDHCPACEAPPEEWQRVKEQNMEVEVAYQLFRTTFTPKTVLDILRRIR